MDISFDRRHHNNVWTCMSYGGINQPYGVRLGQENLQTFYVWVNKAYMGYTIHSYTWGKIPNSHIWRTPFQGLPTPSQDTYNPM